MSYRSFAVGVAVPALFAADSGVGSGRFGGGDRDPVIRRDRRTGRIFLSSLCSPASAGPASVAGLQGAVKF